MEEKMQEQIQQSKPVQRVPEIKTTVERSKDGKWVIYKTIITDIKSVNYFKKFIE